MNLQWPGVRIDTNGVTYYPVPKEIKPAPLPEGQQPLEGESAASGEGVALPPDLPEDVREDILELSRNFKYILEALEWQNKNAILEGSAKEAPQSQEAAAQPRETQAQPQNPAQNTTAAQDGANASGRIMNPDLSWILILLAQCGQNSDLIEDVDDLVELFLRILEEMNNWMLEDPKPGQKTEQLYRDNVQDYSRGRSERTGGFLARYGQKEAAAKIGGSVQKAVEDRIRQAVRIRYGSHPKASAERSVYDYLSRRLLDGIPPQKKFSRSAAPWPEARKGFYSGPEMRAADQMIAQARVYERHYQTVRVKNEELLGFEAGLLDLKAQAAGQFAGSLAGPLQKAVDQLLYSILDRTDNALREQAQGAPPETAAAYAPLNRAAVQSVRKVMGDKYRQTGDVTKAVLQGAQYAENVFLNKKQSEEFSSVLRYRLASNFWEGTLLFRNNEERRGFPFALIRRDWNNYMDDLSKHQHSEEKASARDLRMRRGLFDSGLLESFLSRKSSGLVKSLLPLMAVPVLPLTGYVVGALAENPAAWGIASVGALVVAVYFRSRLVKK